MVTVAGVVYWFDLTSNTIKQADAEWKWTPAVFANDNPKGDPATA